MGDRLAYVLRLYDPDTDTHFRYHYHLIRELQARGHEVTPVFQEMRGEWEGAVSCRLPGILGSLEIMLRVFWLRLRGVKKFYTHYVYPAGIAAGISTRLLGGHTYFWNCGMMWRLHGKKKGLKRVAEWLAIQAPFRLALYLSQTLITCTPKMKQLYKKHYSLKEKPIEVIPNWVDRERFSISRSEARKQLSIPPKANMVLFVHRLSERKGAHRLKRIAQNLSGAQLLVIGDGPLKGELEKASKDLPLKLIGKVPNKKIPVYMAAADVFIMPSREEGFGRVAIEAMAAGTPVLATPVGGVPDVVPDERFLSSYEKFPETLAKLLEDSDMKKQMSRAGLEFVADNFTFDKAVQKFSNVFQR